tara:strand:+ start:46 stop:1404 length:1359 start_codon:yes stop_codon:yes gene_type:complete
MKKLLFTIFLLCFALNSSARNQTVDDLRRQTQDAFSSGKYELALDLATQCSKNQDDDDQFNRRTRGICSEWIAEMYFDGLGVKKNYNLVLFYIEKAESQGFSSYTGRELLRKAKKRGAKTQIEIEKKRIADEKKLEKKRIADAKKAEETTMHDLNLFLKLASKNQNIVSDFLYYSNGKLKSETRSLKGKLHGQQTWWYKNGDIKKVKYYKNGKEWIARDPEKEEEERIAIAKKAKEKRIADNKAAKERRIADAKKAEEEKIKKKKESEQRALSLKDYPGFRDLKPGLHYEEVLEICPLQKVDFWGQIDDEGKSSNWVKCYGIDNIKFKAHYFFEGDFLSWLTLNMGPIVNTDGFLSVFGQNDSNILIKMQNTMDKKYTLDYGYSERDRQLFNESEKSNLYRVYSKGQIILEIVRQVEDYSSNLFLYIHYLDPTHAEVFLNENRPVIASEDDF